MPSLTDELNTRTSGQSVLPVPGIGVLCGVQAVSPGLGHQLVCLLLHAQADMLLGWVSLKPERHIMDSVQYCGGQRRP